MSLDLPALRALAEKATLAHSIGKSHGWSSTEIMDAEAYRLAVESPDVVLRLLDEVEAARRVVEAARKSCIWSGRKLAIMAALDDEVAAFDAAVAKREAL